MENNFKLMPFKEKCLFYIWVTPNAKQTKIMGLKEEYLKLLVHAPAVENKANQEILRFFKNLFQIKAGDIDIHFGENSRKKGIVVNLEKEKILKALEPFF